ncbi:transposase [Streptomyces sp. V2I9]|uniref:transposase n=1 Tax=Streptomyces sp. V2I9 TaxID=3042304 RepID=UPI00278563F5|nr:transposase [Streptomyces sp. V2I9]MDQ0987938.1 hypothetical protein [Streptomyces sp. V2I9]
MREQGAWLVFADESGLALRPAKARTWARAGRAPVVRVAARAGRVSLAGTVCVKAGCRTRPVYRMLVHHPHRRGEKKGFRERDFAGLLDAAHHQLGGNMVLVWDNSTQHVDALLRRLPSARSGWLTVYRLPPYAPDLNPAEGVWANLKHDLGNLAACTVDQLADLTHTRLKRMQYRADLLDGFIAETSLTMTSP